MAGRGECLELARWPMGRESARQEAAADRFLKKSMGLSFIALQTFSVWEQQTSFHRAKTGLPEKFFKAMHCSFATHGAAENGNFDSYAIYF